MKKIVSFLCMVLSLNASDIAHSDALTIESAIEILKSQNLEIKGASFDVDSARQEQKLVDGVSWGKLDFIQDVARTNDAGNVFGFKLTSREANFGDFGFSEFLTPLGMAIGGASQGQAPQDMSGLLSTEPKDLNYPDDRNFFQSKLKYEIPLFTGFKLSGYSQILRAMTKLKGLDKDKVVNEKIYQLRKTFYDMALLRDSETHLETILVNIEKLEYMTQSMIEVGYAKKVDILEVRAKKGNVERLLAQMASNQELLYHYISFLLNQKVTDISSMNSMVAMPTYTDEDILQTNIDIQRAATGLEIRGAMVRVNESAYYPMIGAFGEIATADDTFLGDANDHKAYTVGARLSWNLYNGGIDDANIQKSKIAQLKTATEVEMAKQGIILKLNGIRTDIKTLDSEIISLDKELTLANTIYENYEGRYKEKLVSMSYVIIKQSEQIQKILELQMVKNKRNKRVFALEKLANGERK